MDPEDRGDMELENDIEEPELQDNIGDNQSAFERNAQVSAHDMEQNGQAGHSGQEEVEDQPEDANFEPEESEEEGLIEPDVQLSMSNEGDQLEQDEAPKDADEQKPNEPKQINNIQQNSSVPLQPEPAAEHKLPTHTVTINENARLLYVNDLQRKCAYLTQRLQTEVQQNQKHATANETLMQSLKKQKRQSAKVSLQGLKLKADSTNHFKEVEQLKAENVALKKAITQYEAVGDVHQLKQQVSLLTLSLDSERQARQADSMLAQGARQISHLNFNELQSVKQTLKSKAETQTANRELKDHVCRLQVRISQMEAQITGQQNKYEYQIKLLQQVSASQTKEISFLRNQKEQLQKLMSHKETVKEVVYVQSEQISPGQRLLLARFEVEQQEQIRKYIALQQQATQLEIKYKLNVAQYAALVESSANARNSSIPLRQYRLLSRKYTRLQNKLRNIIICQQQQHQQPHELAGSQDQLNVIANERYAAINERYDIEDQPNQLLHKLVQRRNSFKTQLKAKLELIQAEKTIDSQATELGELRTKVKCLEEENDFYTSRMCLLEAEFNRVHNIVSQTNSRLLEAQRNNLQLKRKLERSQIPADNFWQRAHLIQTQIKLVKVEQDKTKLEQALRKAQNSLNQAQKLLEVNITQHSSSYASPQLTTQQQIVTVCPGCIARAEDTSSVKQLGERESQTEQAWSFHVREVKELLQRLRKSVGVMEEAGKKVDEQHELVKTVHIQYKGQVEKLNVKHLDLQKERNANEEWRKKAREEIKGQFQDIRQLIQSDRLLVALQRAADLIRGLQGTDQKGVPESAQVQ